MSTQHTQKQNKERDAFRNSGSAHVSSDNGKICKLGLCMHSHVMSFTFRCLVQSGASVQQMITCLVSPCLVEVGDKVRLISILCMKAIHGIMRFLSEALGELS